MMKAKGFTLLELLVVIVIIGLLAGYVAPRYFSQVGKSEVQVARAQICHGGPPSDRTSLRDGRRSGRRKVHRTFRLSALDPPRGGKED